MIEVAPSDLLRQLALQLVMYSPVLLVYAVGVYLAITSLELYRRPALLLLCGVGLEIVLTLAGPIAIHLAIQSQTNQQADGRHFQAIAIGLGFLQTLLHAVAIGLIIAAVFVDRTPQIDRPE